MNESDAPRVEVAHRAPVPLKAVALYEAGKALVALSLGVAALFLFKRDLDAAIVTLAGHLGLSVDGPFAVFLIHSTERVEAMGGPAVMGLVLAYATVRLVVAYGLWQERAWGELLGAVSGAVYLPFELEAWHRHPGWFAGLLLAGNLAIVAYLCALLWLAHQKQKRLAQSRAEAK